MGMLTTADELTGRQRLSIEKTVSMFVGIASTIVILLRIFGVIEPAQAGEATTAINLLGGQVTQAALVLLPVSGLWYRSRQKQDDAA